MARGRSHWKKLVNGGRLATLAFSSLERHFPTVSSAINYYSRMSVPNSSLLSVQEKIPLRIGTGRYRSLYAQVQQAQVDLPLIVDDPYSTTVSTWLFEGAVVPGHTSRLVDANQKTLVSATPGGNMRWTYAHPFPWRQRNLRVEGIAAAYPARLKNYYHALINHLLPLAHSMVRYRKDLQKYPVVIAASEPPAMVLRVVEALRLLGFNISLLSLKSSEKLVGSYGLFASTTDSTDHPSHGFWAGAAGEELIWALDRVVPAIRTPQKIYVARSAEKKRAVSNYADFENCSSAAGFETLRAVWSNFDLQYRTFRQASEVLSVHGAGLANLCWCRPETVVTEVTPVNARRSHYLQIAAERSLDFDFFFADAERADQSYSVNSKLLSERLRNLHRRTSRLGAL